MLCAPRPLQTLLGFQIVAADKLIFVAQPTHAGSLKFTDKPRDQLDVPTSSVKSIASNISLSPACIYIFILFASAFSN